jgi:GTPase SAR1 family protein
MSNNIILNTKENNKSNDNYIDFHPLITNKLNYYLKSQKIPNILFHGPNGSGKRTLVNNFINNIYNYDKELIKNYVLNVNCAHGKGIKFIREDLKFFAKMHINITKDSNCNFKTIILSNADNLTIDAQSALRRCIELFSHNTRFFIIVEDKYKLLKPILSRFCEIYISLPLIDNKQTNLHTYFLQKAYNNYDDIENKKKNTWLKTNLKKPENYNELIELSNKLYEKGYSGLDLMNYIEIMKIDDKRKYELLICLNKVKKEFRNEKLFISFILNLLFFRSDYDLENISFM